MVGGGVITSSFFTVLNLLLFALLCFKVFVFVDAAIRPGGAYLAAGKLTKVAWLIILAISALYDLKWGSFTSILTIVGAAAAIIYMVDVRPALRQIPASRTRRGAANDGRHDGPYGPW